MADLPGIKSFRTMDQRVAELEGRGYPSTPATPLQRIDQRLSRTFNERPVTPNYAPEAFSPLAMKVMNQTASQLPSVADMTPVVGEIIGGAEMYDQYQRTGEVLPQPPEIVTDQIESPAGRAVVATGAGLAGILGMMGHRAGRRMPMHRQRGMIGGMQSKRVNPEAKQLAERLKAEGADRDTIFAETMRRYGQGWYEGAGKDGPVWKYEEPDVEAQMAKSHKGEPVATKPLPANRKDRIATYIDQIAKNQIDAETEADVLPDMLKPQSGDGKPAPAGDSTPEMLKPQSGTGAPSRQKRIEGYIDAIAKKMNESDDKQ